MDLDILTAERLRSLLSYDPTTGIFEWCVPRRGRELGRPAGSLNRAGYIRISIDYRIFYAHRLAWLYCYGEWPEGDIDHINRIKSDNRITNLRDASRTENMQNRLDPLSNSSSGYLGVAWSAQKKKWQAVIVVDGKARHLGFFVDPRDAHAAYMAAKIRYHPAFAAAA